MNIQSYKKKNGKTAYKFRFYIGKVQGKDRYIKRSGFDSKAEARSAITQITIDLNKPKSDMKFMELYLEWLKGYKKDVKESTYLKTTKQFEKHVIPLIGSTKISDFTPLTLQENANTWSNDLKYGRKVLGMVKKILNHAVKMQYLQSNPAIYATAPKMKREIQEKRTFTTRKS
ncbi:Phage integrase (fragment) [Lactococcus piscium]